MLFSFSVWNKQNKENRHLNNYKECNQWLFIFDTLIPYIYKFNLFTLKTSSVGRNTEIIDILFGITFSITHNIIKYSIYHFAQHFNQNRNAVIGNSIIWYLFPSKYQVLLIIKC